jgi:hypothetical protein
MGAEVEQIEDPEELKQIRRQAQWVQLKGLLVAIPLVLLALTIPPL